MPLPRADPAVARRVGGPPRRVRRARHRLASRARSVRGARRRPQGRAARRRRPRSPYDLFLGVPGAPGARRRGRVRADRRRLDPRRPAHARDVVPRRLRRRRRHQRRARRRPACSPRARPPSSPTQIVARHPRATPSRPTYDGRGICYLEFGDDQVAKVDVTFASGQTPHGKLEGPSAELAADKVEFGTSRVRRWFGREWSM